MLEMKLDVFTVSRCNVQRLARMFKLAARCSCSANARLANTFVRRSRKNKGGSLTDWKRDTLISADCSKFADAYRIWVEKGSRENDSIRRYPGLHADRSFIEAIRSVVLANHGVQFSSVGLPTTRSGWSNWRSGRGAACRKFSLAVCEAVFEITGVDPTTEQVLLDWPVNYTDMVALGPAFAERAPEANKESSTISHDIKVAWLECRLSQSRELWLADMKPNPRARDKDIAIGSFSCAIQRLRLVVASEQRMVPLLHNCGVESGLPNGIQANMQLRQLSNNEDLADGTKRLEWSIEPAFPQQALQCSFSGFTLSRIPNPSPTDVSIELVAELSDVVVKFSFFRDSVASDRDVSWAKTKLMEQLLKTKICGKMKDGRVVISRAKAKLS